MEVAIKYVFSQSSSHVQNRSREGGLQSGVMYSGRSSRENEAGRKDKIEGKSRRSSGPQKGMQNALLERASLQRVA